MTAREPRVRAATRGAMNAARMSVVMGLAGIASTSGEQGSNKSTETDALR